VLTVALFSNTAILLRRVAPRAKILHGSPERVVPFRRSEDIALIASGGLVAYLLEHAGTHRLFVFRTTVPWDCEGTDRVPGVWPGVRLLVSVQEPGAIDRVEGVFNYLARRNRRPDELSDIFWLRVSHVMGGTRTNQRLLPALLAKEKEPVC
jgi:hypothetical protein